MNKTGFYRYGLGGGMALALALSGQAAIGGVGGSAYFSFEGDINTVGDEVDFNVGLTRSVSSLDDLRFVTYASSGGTNAAGDTIGGGGGGIDSVLQFFDSLDNSRGYNDDHLSLDSLVSWSTVQINGTPLNPDPLASGDYRLNLHEFGNNQTGAFAVDLIGPADGITFSGFATTGTTTFDSLKFGTTGGGSAFYQHTSTSGNLSFLDELVIANTGEAFFNLFGNTIAADGLTTLNAGGTLNIAGGTLNANGGMLVNGGTLSHTTGGLNFGNGSTFTASNNAQVSYAGSKTINNGQIYEVNGGADLSFTGYLDVGDGTNGELIVDGSGSTLMINSISYWGNNGGTAEATFRNQATGNFNGNALRIALGTTSNTTGIVRVESGADLNLGELTITHQGPVDGSGSLTVTGSGSTVNQSAGSALTLGHATNGTATLTVENGGVFNASNTGAINVNATGNLNVDSGTFQARGPGASDDGGTINTSGTVTVTGNGLVNLNGKQPADYLTAVPAGQGGALNATGGTIDLSGTARILGSGGRAGDEFVGPAGGSLTITGGAAVSAVDSSLLEFNGGTGGSQVGFGVARPGGAGGTVTVTSGSLNLTGTAKLTLDGGLGGQPTAVASGGGQGGTGGTLSINGGSVMMDASALISLGGGNGSRRSLSSSFPGGDAGAGGQVLLSTGSMTINGGLLTLDAGTPATATGGFPSGAPGAHGTIDVTGGTFEMNGGEVFTGTFQRSGVGIFNHNDGKLAVAGGTYDNGTNNLTLQGNTHADMPTLILDQGATAPTLSHTITVGDTTKGRIELLGGAAISNINTHFGHQAGSTGQGLIDGPGTNWTSSSSFWVGYGGAGELTISNQAAVNLGDQLVIASRGDANVHITSGASMNVTTRLFVTELATTGVLTVDGGASLTVGGVIWTGGQNASSDSTINVSGSGTVFNANLDLNIAGGPFEGDGTGVLDISNGAQVNVATDLRVYSGGTVNFSGGTLTADTINHTNGGVFNFAGGTLHVDNFEGTLNQQGGTLAPGSSAGLTVITNNYGLTAGTLEIELGGTTAGVDFDQVEVLENAQLYGDLDVSLINGFVPTYGDSFNFLFTWGGVIDVFNSISLPAVPIPNAAWNLFNDGNGLFLNLDSTLVGDLNNDGFVGIDDLSIVLGNWNQTVPNGDPLSGDPSGDGFVGIDDLNTILGNWNAGTPPPISIAGNIPEPATLMLLCVGGLAAMRRR